MFPLAALLAASSLLLTGAVAGLFFAFSVAVMPALDRVEPASAVAAMQSVNHKIQNPVFLTAFLLAPVAAAATGAVLLTLDHKLAAALFLTAAATYLLGAFLPTAVVNVPMNETLAAAGTPTDPARAWAGYSPRWTAWNTARTAFSTLSLLLIGAGLWAWGRDR
ncbi:DUF1772 domain-containing protein [Streptomyces capparidis]